MKTDYDYSLIFTSLKELKNDTRNSLIYDTIKDVESLEPEINELMKIINDNEQNHWVGYTRT